MTNRLGYLSGAPRVSTRAEAALSGPRAHVLGVLSAFTALEWQTRPFVVGDRVPESWVVGQHGGDALQSSWLKRLAADLVRLLLGPVDAWRATREIGAVDWVYERFASFRALGWWFQRRGVPWILETNALLFAESSTDRNTIALTSVARSVEIWAYRKCDALVCVTDDLAGLLAHEAGVDPAKIVVVPNGVDVEHFDPAKHTAERVFDGPTIGFVGSLIGWQALDLLIESLADLRSEGVDYKLVVVGDGPMRLEWQALTRSSNQVDDVRFVGRVPWSEVPSYIAGFDLGYSGQVSLDIGKMYLSPLKLYEYMAMGRPVVASAFEDAQRLMGDGTTGFLFRAADKEDLKRALRTAWAQREAWGEMGARARREVVKEHSWVARVREMIRRIEPILERKYGTP